MNITDKPLKVRLTSDSPAMNGSCISFTAALEFPPCQKEDSNGDLVYDEHCDDGMMEASGASSSLCTIARGKMSCILKGCIYISRERRNALFNPFTFLSANGQVRSGYVFNWTSWLDDYGFGKCTDLKRCNVFPDGKPFPQTSDWRHRGYVYVWHTMGEFQPFTDPNDISALIIQCNYTNVPSCAFSLTGQYFETCDGSSSHLTLNTTNMTFGAGVMEVMVYRKRERRKYSPLTTDSTVFFVTGLPVTFFLF